MKPVVIGFLFGFVGTLIAPLGLQVRIIEMMSVPFLAPMRLICQPIMPMTHSGQVTLTLALIFNSALYALLFWAGSRGVATIAKRLK